MSRLRLVGKLWECAALLYLLLFVLFPVVVAPAVWGIDQMVALHFLWVISRITLTGSARKYQTYCMRKRDVGAWPLDLQLHRHLHSALLSLGIMHQVWVTSLCYFSLQLCVWQCKVSWFVRKYLFIGFTERCSFSTMIIILLSFFVKIKLNKEKAKYLWMFSNL